MLDLGRTYRRKRRLFIAITRFVCATVKRSKFIVIECRQVKRSSASFEDLCRSWKKTEEEVDDFLHGFFIAQKSVQGRKPHPCSAETIREFKALRRGHLGRAR